MSAVVIGIVVLVLILAAIGIALVVLKSKTATTTDATEPASAPASSTPGPSTETSNGFYKIENYKIADNMTDNNGTVFTVANIQSMTKEGATVEDCIAKTKSVGSSALGFAYNTETKQCRPLVIPTANYASNVSSTVTYVKNGDSSYKTMSNYQTVDPKQFSKWDNKNAPTGFAPAGFSMIKYYNSVSSPEGCKDQCDAINKTNLSSPCHAAFYAEYKDIKTQNSNPVCVLASAKRDVKVDTYIKSA